MGVDTDICAIEYVDVAPFVCAEASSLTDDNDRNRLLWSNVLDGAWLQKHFANRIETITVLPLVIRFYLAVLDGECQVERDLGTVLAESSEHTNLQVDGIDDLLMIREAACTGLLTSGMWRRGRSHLSRNHV